MPAAWRTWPGRYIPRRQGRLGELGAQFTARGAVHPMQAMLNFAITVLAARVTRVVIARGLDPAFGFLHDGRKPGRLSLVWDAIEPLRPGLVQAVFEFAGKRTFERKDFNVFVDKASGERSVRLAAALAREMAVVVMRAVPVAEAMPVVRWLIQRFV